MANSCHTKNGEDASYTALGQTLSMLAFPLTVRGCWPRQGRGGERARLLALPVFSHTTRQCKMGHAGSQEGTRARDCSHRASETECRWGEAAAGATLHSL